VVSPRSSSAPHRVALISAIAATSCDGRVHRAREGEALAIRGRSGRSRSAPLRGRANVRLPSASDHDILRPIPAKLRVCHLAAIESVLLPTRRDRRNRRSHRPRRSSPAAIIAADDPLRILRPPPYRNSASRMPQTTAAGIDVRVDDHPRACRRPPRTFTAAR